MNETREMHCEEVVEVVTDYLERALAEDDRRRLEAHLAECEGCEVYIAQMRQTVVALRRLDEGEGAPRDLDALLAAFRRNSPT